MEELKKEVREARRIKMLHQPSKVGIYLLYNSVYQLECVYSLHHMVTWYILRLSRQWIWKMKYEFYVTHLLRSPRIVLIFWKRYTFYCYKYLVQFVSILELVLFSVLEVSINNTSAILFRSMMRICHFFYFGGKAMVLLGSVTKSELCVSSHCCPQTASSCFIVNIWSVSSSSDLLLCQI